MNQNSATDVAPLTGDELAYLIRWAGANNSVVTLDGQCGFGRECVGILTNGSYPDYDHDEMWRMKPTDAYHKHDCLAVLGRGPVAERQLFDWVKAIDAAGGRITVESRRPDNDIDALLHGFTSARIVFESGSSGVSV